MSKTLKSKHDLFWNIKNLLYMVLIFLLLISGIALFVHNYPTQYKQQEIKNQINALQAKKEVLQKQKIVNDYNCIRIRKINQDIKELYFTQEYAKPITLIGILTGTFCFLSLIVAFIVFKRLGNHAKQSDVQMYKNFMKAWRIMQFIILFFLVNFILSCCMSLLIIDLWGPILLIAGFGVLICWQTIGLTYVTSEEETIELFAQNIPHLTDHPLWSLVLDIAKKLVITPPDNIILGVDNNFFITNNTVILSFQQTELTGVTLYISYSYMRYLTLEELTAIIAHELAHKANNDINEQKQLYGYLDRLINNIQLLRQNLLFFPVFLLAWHFFQSFHQAILHWQRHKEALADRASMHVGSKQDIALSLLKTEILSSMLERALSHYNYTGHKKYLLLGYLTESVASQSVTDINMLLMQSSDYFDTHPTLAERLTMLSIEITPSLISKAQAIQPTKLIEQLLTAHLENFELEYQQFIKKQSHDYQETLTEVLDQNQTGTVPIQVRQKGIIRFLLACFGAFFFTMLSTHMISEQEIYSETVIFMIAIGLCIFFAIKIIAIFKRYNSILLTISQEGLSLPGFNKIIPWDQIEDAYTAGFSKKIHLTINVDFKLKQTFSVFNPIKYDAKKHHIRIKIGCITAKTEETNYNNVDKLYALFIRYSQVYQASQELQRFKDQVDNGI